MTLRKKLIKLAQDNPPLRKDILPLLKKAWSDVSPDWLRKTIDQLMEDIPLFGGVGANMAATINQNLKSSPSSFHQVNPESSATENEKVNYELARLLQKYMKPFKSSVYPIDDKDVPVVIRTLKQLRKRIDFSVPGRYAGDAKQGSMADKEFRAWGPAKDVINKTYELEGTVQDQISRTAQVLITNANHLGMDRAAMMKAYAQFQKHLDTAFNSYRDAMLDVSKKSQAYKDPYLWHTK